MDPLEYAEKNFDSFVDQLKELVKIPSVSFEGFPESEVRKSAEAVASLLKATGLENVEILEIEGAHPYVYGDLIKNKGPTLLLYAHHDVQPPGREELWKSAPFDPQERNGRLYGRGAADDKAGIIVHTSAIASYLKTVGKLPINVRVIIEGEEEIGSSHLEKFLERYRSKFQADALVLTDTANFDTGIPTITTSLRGIVATEVEVRAIQSPLHSGLWGGPVPDPALALAKMLASLVDDEGKIQIGGIMRDVAPLTPLEAESLAKLGYSEVDLKKQANFLKGVKVIGGNKSPLLKMTRLPSLAVNAIQVSTRKGVSNVINDVAWCKVGIRTVPNMNAEKTLNALKDHLKANAPWGVEVKFSKEQMGDWWVTKPEHAAFDVAARALSKAFGRDCVFLGCGGSIPFVQPFANVLGGVPALLIGVEDPYTNAHSENESLHLGDFKKSILGAVHLYELFKEIR